MLVRMPLIGAQADMYCCKTCLCALNRVFYVALCQGNGTQNYGLSLQRVICAHVETDVDCISISHRDVAVYSGEQGRSEGKSGK